MDGRATERADVVRFLRETEARYEQNSKDPVHDVAGRERCRSKAAVLRTVAVYIERGDHVAPVERTPEVVLRAMLRAYEAGAIEAETAYMRTCPDVDAAVAALPEAERLGFWCGRLRRETASVIAWGGSPNLVSEIAADYEARLCGERPLDAPPIEEVL